MPTIELVQTSPKTFEKSRILKECAHCAPKNEYTKQYDDFWDNIEWDNGNNSWTIDLDTEDTMFVLYNINFCPFCGEKILIETIPHQFVVKKRKKTVSRYVNEEVEEEYYEVVK